MSLYSVLAAAAPAATMPGDSPEAAKLADRCGLQVVTRTELTDIIASIDDYAILAAPNEGRFIADILLELANRYRQRRPNGPPFRIRPETFFHALLEVTGLPPNELPVSDRKAYQYGQNFVVEYRTGRVIESIDTAREPVQALAVRVAWPDGDNKPDNYYIEDTQSEPNVEMRFERVITYRLLDFGDWVAYDGMRGVVARPTSGALGIMFKLLGMTRIERSVMAVAEDRTQLNVTRVRKLFTFTAAATITPDGRAGHGIPEDRPDLKALRERLEVDFKAEYAGEPPSLCPRHQYAG